jgi:hypothetical protein
MPVVPSTPEIPEQEVVEIRNQGSYTIPQAARKAHRLLLDVEVISVTRNQYLNLQYNLPQGEYGNVTYWNGASISRTEKIKYPSQRLIDWVNIEAGIANIVGGTGYVILQTLREMAIALGLIPVEGDRSAPNTWGYPVSHLKFVCYPDTQIRITCQWYPFVDYPEVEETDPDLDDPASGEDEYPSPRRNPRDDPWKDNNPPTGPDPNRDERDYGDDNDPPPPPSPGPDCTKTYYISWSVTATNEQGGTATTEGVTGLQGEITGFDTYFNPAFNSWAYRAIRKSCAGEIEYVNMFGTTGAQSISGSVSSVVEA